MPRFESSQLKEILDGKVQVTVSGGHSLLLRTVKLGDIKNFIGELTGKNDKARRGEIENLSKQKQLVEVPPGSKLQSLSMATQQFVEASLPWVYVRVVDSNATDVKGAEGIVPKSVFHDMALPHAYDKLTGVTYGGYKWAESATHRVVNFKVGNCSHCSQNANQHKIYETCQSNADAFQLLRILKDQKWAGGSPAMIGVLHALAGDWRVYWAGYSGKLKASGNDPHWESFNRAVETLALEQQAPWKAARHFKPTDKHLLCTGDDTLANVRQFAGPTFDMTQLVCAAPKLIQAAHREGDIPVAMSEIWYNPEGRKSEGGYPHGAIVDSCNLCRMSIPPMLCKRPTDLKGPTAVNKFVPRH